MAMKMWRQAVKYDLAMMTPEMRVSGLAQSNQIGKIYSIKRQLELREGIFYLKSNSKYMIEGLTKNITKWDDIE